MRYIVLLPMPPVSQSASLPMFSRCLSHSMFAACTCSFCFITKLSAESCFQPESFLQPGWPVHLTNPTKMFQSSKSPKTSRVQIPFQQQLSRTIVYLPSQCLPSIGFTLNVAQSIEHGASCCPLESVSVAARNEGNLRASPLDRGQPLKVLTTDPLFLSSDRSVILWPVVVPVLSTPNWV